MPTRVSFVRADAGPLRVVLTWQATGDLDIAPSVERREDAGAWLAIGIVRPDGAGLLRFEDATAQPQKRYAYRLSWSNGAAAATSAEVQVSVPALRFALMGLTPNPSRDGLTVAFSLPDAQPARLEVMDLAGRRVLARDVGGLGPGDHVMAMAPAGVIRPGIYLVRLERGAASVVKRACVIK